MLRRALLLLLVAAWALISPAPLRAWRVGDAGLERVPIPPIVQAVGIQTSADFDADGIPETLISTRGRALLQTAGQTRWQSPPAWQVKQAQITDLNHDGIPEATLLVWRPFKPWPVDAWLPSGGRIQTFHDASGMSCHMILIAWKQGSFRELWAGSAMAGPVQQFAAADVLGDGRQYLVTLVGEYDDPPSAASRRLQVWEWNGFGFSVVHGLADSFRSIVPVQTEDGRAFLLTD